MVNSPYVIRKRNASMCIYLEEDIHVFLRIDFGRGHNLCHTKDIFILYISLKGDTYCLKKI